MWRRMWKWWGGVEWELNSGLWAEILVWLTAAFSKKMLSVEVYIWNIHRYCPYYFVRKESNTQRVSLGDQLNPRGIVLYLSLFIYFERHRERVRGAEPEGDRIPSRLCTVGAEPDLGLKLTKLRPWPELKSRVGHLPKRLSHPGTPSLWGMLNSFIFEKDSNSELNIHLHFENIHYHIALSLYFRNTLTYSIKGSMAVLTVSFKQNPIPSYQSADSSNNDPFHSPVP